MPHASIVLITVNWNEMYQYFQGKSWKEEALPALARESDHCMVPFLSLRLAINLTAIQQE